MSESWAWWYMPVVTALKKWSQEDPAFKASLCYIVGPYLGEGEEEEGGEGEKQRARKEEEEEEEKNIKQKRSFP
jgi:hypothetical protein